MKTKLLTIAIIAALISPFGEVWAGSKDTLAHTRLEKRADRVFIGGRYDRAMQINARAEQRLPQGSYQRLRLELKMARLYTLMQQYDNAIVYYEKVREAAEGMLSVEDVCLYIDNMRLAGDAQSAEVVARTYAFRTPYNRNQRYLNMLSALENKHHYYGRGDADYKVKLYDGSTSKPEYWVGGSDGETFYAVSHSTLQDPLKIYFHRNQYLLMTSDKEDSPMKSIPRELHSGPVAFSPDGRMMVATGIEDSFRDHILSIDRIRGLYPTRLFFSVIEESKGRWSAFKPLFTYEAGYSYAHPSFFDEGRSLVFSSDAPGGYGGMDLWACRWSEVEGKWGTPVNLGPEINTEGDEIYPFVKDNRLYFSSNGLEGFGGYDLYHVLFRAGTLATSGTLFHYTYPLNTTGNDFGLYIDGRGAGYFISDRRGAKGKDDIYTFDASPNSLGSNLGIGVSQQSSAMSGNLNLIAGLGRDAASARDIDLPDWLDTPREDELIASVYFDFDRWNISAESVAVLDEVLSDRGVNHVRALSIVGYADELGGEHYNKNLSKRRADEVAAYLRRGNIAPELFTEGRGRLVLSIDDLPEALQTHGLKVESRMRVSLEDRIKMMRKARRVDIYVKKQ